MVRWKSKTVVSEVKEEVPPLEFSRLGYPRNHSRTPSPSPAGRSTRSPSPAARLFKKNTTQPKPTARSNKKVNAVNKVKAKSLANAKADDINSSSAKANTRPPRINRKKELREARDNILNQLKDRGSRDTSRTRPPLPSNPDPVLSNVVNQVYLAQRLHSSLRSQSFASTTPHEFEGSEAKGKNRNPIKNIKIKNAVKFEDTAAKGKKSNPIKTKVKNTDEFKDKSKGNVAKGKKSKALLSTTSSMETLRILNASQAAAGAKKDSVPNKNADRIISLPKPGSVPVPSIESLHVFSRSISSEVNKIEDQEIDIDALQKDIMVDIKSEDELIMVGEILQADDSGWNCFKCGTSSPMRDFNGTSINGRNSLKENLTATIRNGDEPHVLHPIVKTNIESQAVTRNTSELNNVCEVKNMRAGGSLLLQASETMADDNDGAYNTFQVGIVHGMGKLESESTGIVSGNTEIAVASNDTQNAGAFDETHNTSSRYMCCT